jgi:hypothetical protein
MISFGPGINRIIKSKQKNYEVHSYTNMTVKYYNIIYIINIIEVADNIN